MGPKKQVSVLWFGCLWLLGSAVQSLPRNWLETAAIVPSCPPLVPYPILHPPIGVVFSIPKWVWGWKLSELWLVQDYKLLCLNLVSGFSLLCFFLSFAQNFGRSAFLVIVVGYIILVHPVTCFILPTSDYVICYVLHYVNLIGVFQYDLPILCSTFHGTVLCWVGFSIPTVCFIIMEPFLLWFWSDSDYVRHCIMPVLVLCYGQLSVSS